MKISNLLNLLFLTIILSSCMTTTDYVGDYKNGKYHGNGSISFSSGEMYEGQWKFGKRNGKGTNIWANGAKYVGYFLNDKRHGYGIDYYANGNRYEGEFKNDKRHGNGKLFFKNGETYSGDWRFGNRNGIGINIWSNGDKYKGEFLNNKRHGNGVFIYNDGRKLSGIWKEDKLIEKKSINQYQDKPWLGVFIQRVTNEIAKSLGLKSATGVLVSETNKDGPAFKYGIKPGDILLEFNGKKMKKMMDLPEFVKNSSVGESINFLIWRNSKILNINVTLESYGLIKKAELLPKNKALNANNQNKSEKIKNKKSRKPKQIKQDSSNQIGSGFYVSKFRHIVTNQHVVNKCKKITVGDSISKQISATLIASDKRNDLAILQTISMDMASADTKSFMQNLSIEIVPIISGGLMRSEDVKGGEEIVVAGYPLGNMVSDTIKVTKGIVSATRGMDNNFSQFEIDAVIRKGNSGGPIYDKRGNIVGVAVSRLSVNRTDTINFGIKGSTVKQFLSANDVPTTWANRAQRIDTQDLYKIASKQTVMVVCHRD